MEFGPRALGNRSILGDARGTEMQSTMNLKIKFRESFRPFAPSVLKDRAAEYFDIGDGQDSPYMLLVADVADDKRYPEDPLNNATGLDRLHQVRSIIPAVTHVDYSARLQTVDETRNPRYHALLRKFEEQTGCPVLINTSFNIRGEPIVCTPRDAYHCFMATNMDALAMGNYLLKKEEQPQAHEHESDEYLASFELD